MILVDRDILRLMKKGKIVIDPFEREQLGPNSYNMRLHPQLLVYRTKSEEQPAAGKRHKAVQYIDMADEPVMEPVTIPEEGLILHPEIVYLGRTVEYTETHGNVVPMLEGRSSIGRLGLTPHIAAGFGDSGFCGTWTLELSVVQPVKVYPYIQICQCFWVQASRKPKRPYCSAKYQNQLEPTPSKMYTEIVKGS